MRNCLQLILDGSLLVLNILYNNIYGVKSTKYLLKFEKLNICLMHFHFEIYWNKYGVLFP